MGTLFLKILALEYVILTVAFIVQKDVGRALYFFGAIILTYGVLIMK